MAINKINDTSAHRDLDEFDPHKYCGVVDHDGAEGIGTGGSDNFTRYDVTGIGPDTDSNITAGGFSLG